VGEVELMRENVGNCGEYVEFLLLKICGEFVEFCKTAVNLSNLMFEAYFLKLMVW
jgi:hypothetical protein